MFTKAFKSYYTRACRHTFVTQIKGHTHGHMSHMHFTPPFSWCIAELFVGDRILTILRIMHVCLDDCAISAPFVIFNIVRVSRY